MPAADRQRTLLHQGGGAGRWGSLGLWPDSGAMKKVTTGVTSMNSSSASASLGAPALLLFMLVLPVFSFFVSPLAAQLSRTHEFQADAYACAQSSGADLASALLKLHEDNAATLTPDPLYVRFYYSHPPASERLAALPAPSERLAALPPAAA